MIGVPSDLDGVLGELLDGVMGGGIAPLDVESSSSLPKSNRVGGLGCGWSIKNTREGRR